MFEGDPTATTPMTRRSGGIPAGRLLALGLLAFALAAFSGRVDLGALVSTATTYPDQAARAAPTYPHSTETNTPWSFSRAYGRSRRTCSRRRASSHRVPGPVPRRP